MKIGNSKIKRSRHIYLWLKHSEFRKLREGASKSISENDQRVNILNSIN